jgi:mono/diheme cytochrome c family protein
MRRMRITLRLIGGLVLVGVSGLAHAQASTPAELLAAYTKQAGGSASPERGQAFFTRKFGRDFDSCAACHGALPVSAGKDLVSEKPIAALAPAASPKRFTDKTAVEYRFGQNCKDVVGRACSAQEKADVLSWLLSLKP